jgi:hypothetical protein
MKSKLTLIAFAVFLFALSAISPRRSFAGIPTVESIVVNVNPSTGTYCTSISTSAYTQVPPSTLGNMENRNGIRVLNLPSNTANMGGIINVGVGGNAEVPSAPTGITKYDLLFVRGNPDRALAIGSNIFLWLLSLHTSAEIACWQEFQQR